MNPDTEICVDASLAVKAVIAEPDNDKADALFNEWAREGKRLIAPSYWIPVVTGMTFEPSPHPSPSGRGQR